MYTNYNRTILTGNRPSNFPVMQLQPLPSHFLPYLSCTTQRCGLRLRPLCTVAIVRVLQKYCDLLKIIYDLRTPINNYNIRHFPSGSQAKIQCPRRHMLTLMPCKNLSPADSSTEYASLCSCIFSMILILPDYQSLQTFLLVATRMRF